MVLYKRKPVEFLPNEKISSNNTELWYIKESGEYFTRYEDYLSRIDYYRQRKFLCEVSGHSGMTFFEAHYEELENSQEADAAFPDPLKEPVLRKANFMTTPRMDKLVDEVYDAFKTDFYPGERVHVIADQEKLEGVVREKARFPERRNPDGSIERAHSRYFVSLDDRPDYEALVDDDHIGRDRHAFTKVVLKSFLKRAVGRDSWVGAPWVVKSSFADKYSIDIRVPPQLTKGYVQGNDRWQNTAGSPAGAHTEAGKSGKGQKGKQSQSSSKSNKDPNAASATKSASKRLSGTGADDTPISPAAKKGSKATLKSIAPAQVKGPPKPLPPPPLKYPLDEDLELPPQLYFKDPRPPLNYISLDKPLEFPSERSDPTGNGSPLKMETVGPLLETWQTLNVFCAEFHLDSFTFDDYAGALEDCANATEPSLLLAEIHCGLLKTLVNAEKKDGEVNIDLPEEPEESEDEQEGIEDIKFVEDEDIDAAPPAAPKQESNFGFSGFAAINKPAPSTQATSVAKVTPSRRHRCRELFESYDWLQKLRERDFQNGGWQLMVIGFLYRLSLAKRRQSRRSTILRILRYLVNSDQEIDLATVVQQYNKLNVNLKVAVIQILCSSTMNTKALRSCMEDDAEAMTDMRKEKVEYQKRRKIVTEQLKEAQMNRRDLDPDEEQLPTPVATEDNVSSLSSQQDPDDTQGASLLLTDEEGASSLSLRRKGDRNASRKRKREDAETIAKKKALAEAAAKQAKQIKAMAKLDKEIEKLKKDLQHCEDKIAESDEDLRQADCYRARVLGKDRYWNRYYWFERNGMPYGGLPQSSTSYANYANGRIWVQGPDPLERAGYIDVEERIALIYQSHYHVTPRERKLMEEANTCLWSSNDWGYYDTPEELTKLMDWFEEKGKRELMLKKELKGRMDVIIEHMLHREAYLYPERAIERKKREEAEEIARKEREAEENSLANPKEIPDSDGEDSTREGENGKESDIIIPPTPTISSRTRGRTEPAVPETAADEGPRKGWLKWKNNSALDAFGHYHSEEPMKRQSRGKAGQKQSQQQHHQTSIQDFARQTRGSLGGTGEREGKKLPLNRQGKPLTRQG